jgi:hypothetical protein
MSLIHFHIHLNVISLFAQSICFEPTRVNFYPQKFAEKSTRSSFCLLKRFTHELFDRKILTNAFSFICFPSFLTNNISIHLLLIFQRATKFFYFFCYSFSLILPFISRCRQTETADKCTEMSSSHPTTVHQFASGTQMEHQKLHINDRIVRENSRLPPDGREYPTQINSNIEKQTSTSLKTKRFVKFIVIVSFSFSLSLSLFFFRYECV